MQILLLAAWLATGGQTGNAAATTVRIDVTVVDRGGRTVAGLTAADFAVELDGRTQRVVAATYLATGAPMMGAVGPTFDAVTPAIPIYRLTVEPPADTTAGREFGVTVTVARPGVKAGADGRASATAIETRETRSSTPPGAALSTPDRLRQAIATGRPERGLQIALGQALRRSANPAELTLDVQVEIAGPAKPPLTALLGVVDDKGAIRTAGQEIADLKDGVYRLDLSLPLAPGAARLRFAVAAADGTIGATEAPIKAALTAFGPLLASDLLRSTTGADGRPQPLLLDAIPRDATAIGAALELYAVAGTPIPPDLLVKMSLEPSAGGQPPVIERIVTPEARDGVLRADAEFPLDRIASGSYVLRASVLAGTTVLGATSAAVIKR